MRPYRNAVILIVVVGLLFGAYMFINKQKPADSKNKPADSNAIKITEIDKDKIVAMTIENKGEKLVFEKKDKDWVLTSPSNIKYDATKIDTIAVRAASLSADKVIEENATDLDQYGLKNPVTVAIKISDGTGKNFEIGDETPTKDAYYFKLNDNNKVYIVSNNIAETFIITKNDIKDKVLFTSKPEDVLGFSLEKGNKIVFSAKKQEDANWIMTAPFEINADSSKFDPAFSSVLKLSIINFVEDNVSDLSKYGLKTPSYALGIDTSSTKTKILLGDEKEKNSEIYAKLENSNDVFTVDEKLLNFVDKPLKEFVDSFAYIVNIADVNKIVVEMDGKTDTIDIKADKDNKDNDKFAINGKDLTDIKVGDKTGDGLFRVYYQNLIGVTLSELDPEAKPSGKADITFTYYLKKAPGTMKVEFISKDNKSYYVFKNGKYSNIIVGKVQFDHLRETYKNLIEAANTKK